LTVAGAILSFIISMRMVFPLPRSISEHEIEGEPFIRPAGSCVRGGTLRDGIDSVHHEPRGMAW
jgi:hypothetical protein